MAVTGIDLPLTRDEVRRGIREYEGLIGYIDHRRTVEPMAKALQYPKLPSKLTESFVGYMIATGELLSGMSPTRVRSGSGADLTLESVRGSVRVEVKGTAQSFTMFSQKDLDADYLVWVDFGVEFRRDRRVRVHVVPRLGQIGIARNTKMTLPVFLTRTAAIRQSTIHEWSTF